MGTRISSDHALAGIVGSFQGQITNRRLGLVLDLLFGFGGTVPVAQEEAAAIDALLELVITIDGVGPFLSLGESFLKQTLLCFFQYTHHLSGNRLDR